MYNSPFHTDNISKLSFLITGGAGFIGSNIADYLMKYDAGKVRILDNLSSGFKENLKDYFDKPNFEFIEGDICHPATCMQAAKGMDIVLHQGALGSVPRSIKNPIATNEANIDGFLNILWAAKENNVKRFVYASSSSVYGDSVNLPKREPEIGNPLSPYAVTKRCNEIYADVFAKTYNMEIIGLRYFNVFGPKQNPKGPYAAVIPLFIDALMHEKSPVIFGDGDQMRDFTFVENAVQANIKAALTTNKAALNQVYNIAVGEKTSVNELFASLKKSTGSSLAANYQPERTGDIRNSFADIAKAKELLGYTTAVKIDEGLKITFDWFKENF